MKKILGLSLLTASMLCAIELSEGNTVQENRINCDNGAAGFEITISNESTSKQIYYNSCDSHNGTKYNGELIVKGGSSEGSSGPETRTVDGVEYTFANGYTEPTAEALNQCQQGFDNDYEIRFTCFNKNLTELGEGYLNITKLSTSTWYNSNKLTNLDNLNNLVEVSDMRFNNNKLTEVNGLENLQRVDSILDLSRNELENVNGLSNLSYVGDTLMLQNNSNLTDISGLSGIAEGSMPRSTHHVELDDRDYDTKMDSDSWLCNGGYSKILIDGRAATASDKSKLCN